MTISQQSDVPESIRSLTPMRPNYVDVFTVTTSGAPSGSPEQWARAGVDRAAGLAGQFVWRVFLGLRLERRSSPKHVAGWKIGDRGDDWIRLEATSWFLTAHIVVHVDDERLSVATFVRYDRTFASLAWPPMSIAHRRAMPGLLRRAVKLRRGTAS